MRARHRRPVMYFAGLDAHLKYVTVAVLDRLGTLVLETTVPTREPERLLAVLAPFRPLEVVLETCPFWPWLYDLLVPLPARNPRRMRRNRGTSSQTTRVCAGSCDASHPRYPKPWPSWK